jgi:hypothetical protein
MHKILTAYGLVHTHVVNEQPDAQRAAMERRMAKQKGVPDFLVFASPPMAIEVKAHGGRVSTEQQRMLDHLAELGWVTAVVRSTSELVALLDATYGRRP